MLNVKTKSSIYEDESYTVFVNKEKYFVKPLSTKFDGRNEVHVNFGLPIKTDANKSKALTEALKKSNLENCCFPIARRCRSESPPPLLTDISTITQTARLQTSRRGNSAKCKKLLKCNGYSNKVLLFPEESWARTAASAYWTLSPIWWNCSQCKVVEVTGTKKYSTRAKMIETDCGNLYIVGSFKKCAEPDFKLFLTSNVTITDFNMGYCMTGSLERGSHKHNTYQTTHFAVIRRAEFNI